MLGRTWGALVLPDIQQRYPLSEIRFPVPLEPTNAAAGLVLEAPVIVCFAAASALSTWLQSLEGFGVLWPLSPEKVVE